MYAKKLLAHIQDFRRPRYQNQLDSHYRQEIIQAVWFAGQATVVLLLSTTSTCTTPSRKSLLDCGQEQLFAARENLFPYLPLCGMPPQDIFVVTLFSDLSGIFLGTSQLAYRRQKLGRSPSPARGGPGACSPGKFWKIRCEYAFSCILRDIK